MKSFAKYKLKTTEALGLLYTATYSTGTPVNTGIPVYSYRTPVKAT